MSKLAGFFRQASLLKDHYAIRRDSSCSNVFDAGVVMAVPASFLVRDVARVYR